MNKPKTMGLVEQTLLGGVSKSKRFSLDANGVIDSLMTTVLAAAVVGGIAFVEYSDAQDWGYWEVAVEAFAAAITLGLAKLGQNWAKDNTPSHTP